MFKHLFTRRRRETPRNPAGLIDRRAPHSPEPMPRMRYY
jgi:hypothetical protein